MGPCQGPDKLSTIKWTCQHLKSVFCGQSGKKLPGRRQALTHAVQQAASAMTKKLCKIQPGMLASHSGGADPDLKPKQSTEPLPPRRQQRCRSNAHLPRHRDTTYIVSSLPESFLYICRLLLTMFWCASIAHDWLTAYLYYLYLTGACDTAFMCERL